MWSFWCGRRPESPAGVLGARLSTFPDASTRSSVFIEESAVVYLSAVQKLVEGSRLVAEKLVLEEGAFSAPGCEVFYGVHLVHPFARVAELAQRVR